MDSSNIADQIIAKGSDGHRVYGETDDFLDRIREVSPSIYRIGNMLFHEHDLIKLGNKTQMLALIDLPDIRLTDAQTAWLYNRLYESAPVLSDRYIRVSRDYVWDAKTGALYDAGAIFRKGGITLSDRDTKKGRR